MDMIQKLQQLPDEDMVAICKTDMVSRAQLSVLIDNLANARREPGASRQQKYAKFVTGTDLGQQLFAVLKAATLGLVEKGPAKPRAVRGDGKQHLAGEGDAAADLERLVDEFVQTHPKISRAKAYEQVMRTPVGKDAYNREKTVRLQKAAQLMGDAYGL
jgi:hypothetical protein